jgi:3-oxoacyl-[acyl-carrier-protein] synthase III
MLYLHSMGHFHPENIISNHGYEPQSKLRGIIPSASRDCSTYQFRRVTFRLYAALSELEFHNKFLEDLDIGMVIVGAGLTWAYMMLKVERGR